MGNLSEAYKTVKFAKGCKVLKIYPDEDSESPRKDRDCFGKMACWHSRYDLGDEGQDTKIISPARWMATLACRDNDDMDMDVLMKLARRNNIILPLYLYDHSGLTISVGKFSCPWDSGQVGWIYASKEDAKKEFGKNYQEKAIKLLEGEVKEYDTYLRGDIWGFQIFAVKKCSLGHEHEEHVDSCWGFYGDDWQANGMLDHFDVTNSEKREIIKGLGKGIN